MKQTKSVVPKSVPGFYSIAECAALAKCSSMTIERAIKAGKLKVLQPGGAKSTRRVPQGNLVDYLYGKK
jgi:excisionase family DNA binding protein